MPPRESPMKDIDEKFEHLIGQYVANIKNGKLRGSTNIALEMVTLLETIINESEHASVYELLSTVRAAGRLVSAALPLAPAAANVARRVLRAIRDEHRASANLSGGGESSGDSLQRLVLASSARRLTLGTQQHDLKEPLRDHLAELRSELESSWSGVCGAARSHVHADELILTYGASALAERFLRAAAPRKYRLILAEGPDLHQSHAMAGRLSAVGVSVTVISSAAVYAVMSRVNKVVLSVTALGGGAALGAAGSLAVTAAAKHFSVPVVALAPLHKLCPQHAASPALAYPALGVHYERHETAGVHVYAPRYDFTPPDHITLFITNLGGSSPSYMYRMLSELYDPSDYTL